MHTHNKMSNNKSDDSIMSSYEVKWV